MELKARLKHLLRLDFEARATEEIAKENAEISGGIAARLSRGSIARQNQLVLEIEDLENEKRALLGVKLAG